MAAGAAVHGSEEQGHDSHRGQTANHPAQQGKLASPAPLFPFQPALQHQAKKELFHQRGHNGHRHQAQQHGAQSRAILQQSGNGMQHLGGGLLVDVRGNSHDMCQDRLHREHPGEI